MDNQQGNLSHTWDTLNIRPTPSRLIDLYLRLLLTAVRIAIRADCGAEIALENTLLEINGASSTSTVLSIAPTEENTLAKLPALNTDEEEESSDKDNAPFPADALVPEDSVVDDGDVQDWENSDESKHDGEEQELVPPHVACPLGEVLLGSRLHHEERAAHVQHLPREEQREPGKAGEGSRTSAEYSVASRVVRFVAACAEVAVAETKHDEREGCEAEGGDPETVKEHVDEDLDGEDTALEL
jgi:hypothetical protein